MTPQRVQEITGRYAQLRVAVVGDFCLDRYLEIDSARAERSIETGRTVHNVVRVRALAGGDGTILNNLREAMELAMAAASVVIHQLGTTGTASVAAIAAVLYPTGR